MENVKAQPISVGEKAPVLTSDELRNLKYDGERKSPGNYAMLLLRSIHS